MSWILSHGDNTMLNLSDLLWWNSPFSQMPPLAFVLEHYMDGDIDGMQLAMQFVSSPIYFSLLCETAREKKSYSNTQLRSSQSCIWFDEVEKFVTVWNWHLRGEIIRRPKRGEAYTLEWATGNFFWYLSCFKQGWMYVTPRNNKYLGLGCFMLLFAS